MSTDSLFLPTGTGSDAAKPRVLVIGGGIVGVCTAYELARAGLQPYVIERGSAVGLGASFGNAGVIAPGYVTPWAAPGMPAKVLKMLWDDHAPVRINLGLDMPMWRWLWQAWRQCDLAAYRRNRERMQRIARYSQACLAQLRERHPFDYERTQGYLQLFRSEEDLNLAKPGLKLLADLGARFQLVDADRARELEPGLNPDTPLKAAVHLPDDESGNCPLFAKQLRSEAEALGARFRFGLSVQSLDVQAGMVQGVILSDGRKIAAQAVVVAAGSDSTSLLQPAGIRLPLYPVKGYSATVTMQPGWTGPRAALMDERYKVAMTRMGQRIRVAGTAELGGALGKIPDAPVQTLLNVVRDWFGEGVRTHDATLWTGARPMLPDGAPLIGPTPIAGLWLNLGHGSSGWAMAPGSARVLADQMTGRKAEIDVQGLRFDDRYAA